MTLSFAQLALQTLTEPSKADRPSSFITSKRVYYLYKWLLNPVPKSFRSREHRLRWNAERRRRRKLMQRCYRRPGEQQLADLMVSSNRHWHTRTVDAR